MEPTRYEVTKSIAGFIEGDVLDVTARYGHWHSNDMKLELDSEKATRSVVVSEKPVGFSESDVLSPSTRIGDWHEQPLTFDPGARPVGDSDSTGPVQITKEELHSFATPAA